MAAFSCWLIPQKVIWLFGYLVIRLFGYFFVLQTAPPTISKFCRHLALHPILGSPIFAYFSLKFGWSVYKNSLFFDFFHV